MTTTWRARQAGPLLAEVLAYCAEHPYTGDALEVAALTVQQRIQGEHRILSVLGEPPDVAAFNMDLLDEADPAFASFGGGILVLNVEPQKLLYRPVYVEGNALSVVFTRVCARCHDSRKVPDWRNWNSEYGEPRPKPCPECCGSEI